MPMPRKYVMEMVADWRGAGMAIHGTDDTEAWFVRNRGNMMLHPATESIVVELLNEPKSVMESRRYAPKKRPLLDDMDQMRRYIEAINYLRKDEGSGVEIACDNPEGEPNATVRIAYMCPHEGRRWKGRRFTGSTVLEALELAAATRMKEYQDACKEDLNEET